MAIDQEMLNEIEQEKKLAAQRAAEAKAKAAANGNGAGFFVLKDGELVRIRPLLNRFVFFKKHSIYDIKERKWLVNAVCAETMGVGKEFCVHCQAAKETKNTRLEAKKEFAVPFWVYGVKFVATGEFKTYPKNDEKVLIRGLQYATFKSGDAIFENLVTMYKMSGDITLHDIEITQMGSQLEKKFTIEPIKPLEVTPFGPKLREALQSMPAITPDSIIDWLVMKNPPALIEDPRKPSGATQNFDDFDPFAETSPAVANGNGHAQVAKGNPRDDYPEF